MGSTTMLGCAVRRAALLAAPVVVLGLLAEAFPRSLRAASELGGSTFGEAIVDLAVVLACGASAWLVASAVLTVACAWCAPSPRWSRRVARAMPRLWREAVLAVVGTCVLSGPAVAHAQPDRPSDPDNQPRIAGLPLPDRPGRTDTTGERAERAKPARADHDRPRGDRPHGDRVVHRGDTLWAIAADSLPPSAGNEQVAHRCAAWYAANRRRIGPDPDLILPGMSLRPPLPPDEGVS